MGEGHPGPCMAALPAAAAWWACPDCLETAARAEAAGFSGAARRTSLSMRCSSGASAPACASSAPAAAAAEALASCSGWGVDARRGRRAIEAQQGLLLQWQQAARGRCRRRQREAWRHRSGKAPRALRGAVDPQTVLAQGVRHGSCPGQAQCAMPSHRRKLWRRKSSPCWSRPTPCDLEWAFHWSCSLLGDRGPVLAR